MPSGRHSKKAGAKSKKPDESSSLSISNATFTNYPPQTPSEFIVEKITGSRFVNGQVEMQVKWADFPPESSTWEPLENLRKCMQMVYDFEEELSRMIQMTNKNLDLQASSGSKKKVDKKLSAIKASLAPAPGEHQLETVKPTGPMSKAKKTSTTHPNAGLNIGENQEKMPIKLLPALNLHFSDDETPPADGEKSSGSNISNTAKKAKPLKGQNKQTPQSQAKQNMTKIGDLPNPHKKLPPQDKDFTIQKQENSISETPEKPIEEAMSDLHSMKLAEKEPEVQAVVQASQKSKRGAKKIQKQESSDDDSDVPLMTPYPAVFGLARGLELDKVVHSFCVNDRHFLFVTWKGMGVVDTVPLEELKEAYPAKVLQYFEKMERRY